METKQAAIRTLSDVYAPLVTDNRDWAADFDRTFSTPVSGVEERIWRETFGDEYPEGLGTHSLLSRTELARFVEEVHVSHDDVFADIGCGRGGPGLWVAAQTGAFLVGVDISQAALDAASARAGSLGLADRCIWRQGSFEATGLEDGSLDAVMSVDALLFTPDKEAATREFARVLRPGGRLLVTTWDYHSQPQGRPPQVSDHRPLLGAAGFVLLTYEETTEWRQRQLRTTDSLLAAVEELAAETGEDREELEADLREMRATDATMIARRLIVAERT
jgi:ubiquinone/menaquinone biosynthesis C-methylase UbiE